MTSKAPPRPKPKPKPRATFLSPPEGAAGLGEVGTMLDDETVGGGKRIPLVTSAGGTLVMFLMSARMIESYCGKRTVTATCA